MVSRLALGKKGFVMSGRAERASVGFAVGQAVLKKHCQRHRHLFHTVRHEFSVVGANFARGAIPTMPR